MCPTTRYLELYRRIVAEAKTATSYADLARMHEGHTLIRKEMKAIRQAMSPDEERWLDGLVEPITLDLLGG